MAGSTTKKKVKRRFKKIFKDPSEIDVAVKMARKFSKAFQEEVKKASIFTGNKNAKELVGMRLKRLRHGDV